MFGGHACLEERERRALICINFSQSLPTVFPLASAIADPFFRFLFISITQVSEFMQRMYSANSDSMFWVAFR